MLFLSLYCNITAQTTHNVYASDYMIFSPSNLNINLGDTVYFENLNSHNVVEVSEESYYNNGIISNGGLNYILMIMLYSMKLAHIIMFVIPTLKWE